MNVPTAKQHVRPYLGVKVLKITICRLPQEALQALAAAHRVDPLDVHSMAENWLVSKTPEAAQTLTSTMFVHPATAQETAAEYLNAGLWQDGTDVVLQMTADAPDKSKIHPMAYYYLAYFAGKLGQPQKVAEYGKLAMALSPDYVFPFQKEAIDVLRAAVQVNPRDARAPYYLGNVLYDWQPEEATRMWEASAAIDSTFAIFHRNLATAYMHLQVSTSTLSSSAVRRTVNAECGLRTPQFDRPSLSSFRWAITTLRKDSLNRAQAFFHQMKRPAIEYKIHLLVVQPHLPQDRRLQIADVMRLFHRAITDIVSSAFHNSTFDAAARQ
jgi:tetratricopeptide (TPR) repeat protein